MRLAFSYNKLVRALKILKNMCLTNQVKENKWNAFILESGDHSCWNLFLSNLRKLVSTIIIKFKKILNLFIIFILWFYLLPNTFYLSVLNFILFVFCVFVFVFQIYNYFAIWTKRNWNKKQFFLEPPYTKISVSLCNISATEREGVDPFSGQPL